MIKLIAQHSPVMLTDTIHLPNDQAYVRTIDAEDGSTVAFCVSNPEVEHQAEHDGEMSIGEQLHLVMAAAPDLLDALAGMMDMFERHLNGLAGPDDAAARYDRARAALAKAVGRES